MRVAGGAFGGRAVVCVCGVRACVRTKYMCVYYAVGVRVRVRLGQKRRETKGSQREPEHVCLAPESREVLQKKQTERKTALD